MNPFAFAGLLITISSLFFGLFVFAKNPKNRMNQIWAIFCLSVAVFGFGGYKIGLVPYGEEETALLLWRLTHLGAALIPVFFIHFVYIWLDVKKKIIFYLSYLQGLFFFGINLYDILANPAVGLFINQVTWVFNSFYWNTHYVFGLFWLYVPIWFGIIIYSHYELLKAYKKSSGIKRAQIKYMFLATVLGFAGGSTSYLICFNINLYPILNFTVPLYPAIMTYSIIRYRWMDIRFIVGKGAIYILSFATAALAGFSIILLNNSFAVFSHPYITGPLVAFFGALVIIPSLNFYEKIASRHFYYTYYSLQQTLQRLGKQLNQVIELDKLTGLINISLLDALKLDRVGIVFKEPKEKSFKVNTIINFNKENIDSLLIERDNFLVQYLAETKNPLVREEIPAIVKEIKKARIAGMKKEIEEESASLSDLGGNMKKAGIGLFFPLFIGKKLIGIIVLGDKLSGEVYTSQELNVLSILSVQVAVALNNSLAYDEINQRKAELEKFYKLTVGRELKMAELKKKIKDMERQTEDSK